MKKFTKEELAEILHKNILQCDKDEFAFLFNIFALTVKEFEKTDDDVKFEIHFKRVYVMRMVANPEKFMFHNEYIDFHLEAKSAIVVMFFSHGSTSG